MISSISSPISVNNKTVNIGDNGHYNGADIGKCLGRPGTMHSYFAIERGEKFVKKLTTFLDCDRKDLVRVMPNNRNSDIPGGTYIHPVIAYDYALWREQCGDNKGVAATLYKLMPNTYKSYVNKLCNKTPSKVTKTKVTATKTTKAKNTGKSKPHTFTKTEVLLLAGLTDVVDMIQLTNLRLNMLIDNPNTLVNNLATPVRDTTKGIFTSPSKLKTDSDRIAWLNDVVNIIVELYDLDHEYVNIAFYEAYSELYLWNWRKNRDAFNKQFGEMSVRKLFIYTQRLKELCDLVYNLWGDGRVPVRWSGQYSKAGRYVDLVPINDLPPGDVTTIKKSAPTKAAADAQAASMLNDKAKEVLLNEPKTAPQLTSERFAEDNVIPMQQPDNMIANSTTIDQTVQQVDETIMQELNNTLGNTSIEQSGYDVYGG